MRWVLLVGMSLALGAGVLLRGGVVASEWSWIAAGLLLMGILSMIGEGREDYVVEGLGWGLIGLVAVQLVPLPEGWVMRLSPASVEIWRGAGRTGWMPMGVAPAASSVPPRPVAAPSPVAPPAAGVKCPKCGTSVAPGLKFCTGCGGAIGAAPAAAPLPVSPPPLPMTPPLAAAGGAKCPKCGAATPAGLKFCNACGQALGAAAPSPLAPSAPQRPMAAPPPVAPPPVPMTPPPAMGGPSPYAVSMGAMPPAVQRQGGGIGLIAGIVVGAALTWLVLAESSRRDREIAEEELAAEAGWIARSLDVAPVSPALVEDVLRAHRRYLGYPPPDALVDPSELVPLGDPEPGDAGGVDPAGRARPEA